MATDKTNNGLEAQNIVLAKEVAGLKAQMAELMVQLQQIGVGITADEKVRPLEEQPWYIKPGSERHAQLLGLTEDPDSELGWKLTDPTTYGPTARPEFLAIILQQHVNELTTPPPTMQSKDPMAPNYAVPMWVPTG